MLVFLVILLGYFRYYEKKCIYFPTKEISATPRDLGLEYEDIYFHTSDGIGLNAWFITRPDASLTILFLHGNAGNLSHRLEVLQILHPLQTNIFIVDWRGYGKSQGTPSEEGLYLDALASYDYLVKEKGIPADSIIVYGKSLGANIAVDLASRVKIKALISDSGFTSAYDMARHIFPFIPVKLFITVKFDALTKIKNIYCPKLIVHSPHDEMIPFWMAKKLFEAAAAPKELYQLGGSHNEMMFINRKEFIERLGKFLCSL